MRTDRTERLLNLVLCLLGARRPVSRAAIRDAVPGYAESASDEAFERMFERDKDELRAMGIPIDTVVSPNGDVEGYRIRSDEYSMPAVAFTGAELAVLGIAAQAWSDAALGSAARGALRKIEAVAGERSGTAPVGLSLVARPGAGDHLLPVLWEAIRSRRVVTFSYRGLRDSAAAERAVEPWGTARVRGAWYLAGHDRDRADTRVFRLSRIDSAIAASPSPGTFAGASAHDVRAVIERLADDDPVAVARIDVTSGGARLRLRAEVPDGSPLVIPYSDVRQLVADVAELGDAVRVIEPPELRDEVRRALAAVAAAHGGEP